MPLVERSHIYERVQLDEYYQNIVFTHLDHFWNLTPLDEVSWCAGSNIGEIRGSENNLLQLWSDLDWTLTLDHGTWMGTI